jgi:hypothetical protein
MMRLILPLALLLFAAQASAQKNRVQPALHWSRSSDASGCIDPRALALRVTALTGDVLVEPTSATLSIEGHVMANGHGGFAVRITSSNAQGITRGERTLAEPSGDCRKLDAAIAFVIALIIDPDLALDQLPAELVALGAEGPKPEDVLLAELARTPPRPYAGSTTVAPPVAADATKAPAPKQVAASWPHYEASAGVVIGVRELPKATLGGQLRIAYAPWRAVALEAELNGSWMMVDKPLGSVRSVSARAYGGALLACPRLLHKRWLFDGCVGPELYAVKATGKGFTENSSDSRSAIAVRAAVGAGVVVRKHWVIRVRGWARYSPRPPRYEYAEITTRRSALDVPSLGVGVTLSMGYAF